MSMVDKATAESCLYFDFGHLDNQGKEKHCQIIDDWIKCKMPGEGENDSILGLFKICLVSSFFIGNGLKSISTPQILVCALHSGSR